MHEVRLIDANAFSEQYGDYYAEQGPAEGFIGTVGDLIAKQPTIEAEPVRHGRWIECDYKHMVARPDQRGDDYRAHLIEEIADSLIMIEQVKAMHGITDCEIECEIRRKIERQMHRIEVET